MNGFRDFFRFVVIPVGGFAAAMFLIFTEAKPSLEVVLLVGAMMGVFGSSLLDRFFNGRS